MSFVQFASSLCSNVITVWLNFFWVALILWAVERLFPKDRVSIASQLRSLRFWVFAGLGTGIAVTVWSLIAAWLHPRPWIVLPLQNWFAHPLVHWSLYVIAPVLSVILYDFFDYWMHRAQHKWLWRLHSIHHSIEELSGINSYFHWSEQFFRCAFILLPAAYLIGIDGVKTAAIAELLMRLQGYYLHSPSSLHVGPVLRRVIADNRFHRIHHSIHPEHFDKNFGAGTSIWDQLFGTAHFPADDDWPATGIAGHPEAKTLGEYLWRPFTRSTRQRAGSREEENAENGLAAI